MNDYKKYYDARDLMQEIIRADLLGPMTGEPEEIIRVKYPTTYYIVGKLYPISKETQTVLSHDDAEELTEISNSDDKLIDTKYGEQNNEDSNSDDEISGCNILNPSAMGITFAVKKETKKINVLLSYALYKSTTEEEAKKQNPDVEYYPTDSLWKRHPAEKKPFDFDLTQGKILRQPVEYNSNKIGELVLLRHNSGKNEQDITRYTLSFKNTQIVNVMEKNGEKRKDPTDEAEKTIFQPHIEITVPGGHFVEVKRNLKLKKIKKEDTKKIIDDDLVMDLLYSKVKSYAQGHGCAVSWDDDGNEDKSKAKILRIKSEFLPEEQILQMRPVTSKDIKNFNDKILDTEYLKEATKNELAEGIENLCDVYQTWINEQRDKISEIEDKERFEEVAKDNLELCEESLKRIRNSADIIMKDDDVYKAFKYANEAINEQNRHKEWISEKEKAKNNKNPIPKIEDITKSFKWYPFQLAFILQELESIANTDSTDRNLVDLLWFPTGGGKTEAYLGLAAFTIFLRRLKHPEDSKGVSVLTRYTYRLLTFQQFERTLRLICACEEIRKNNKKLGDERISIGMWIGSSYTPNKFSGEKGAYLSISKQKSIQNEIKTNTSSSIDNDNSNDGKGNPLQITKCPWCGATISAKNYSFDSDKMVNLKTQKEKELATRKMYIHCPNEECLFSTEDGIPAVVVDEQIYDETPTFVIATVDKFAQVPLKAESGTIFGYKPDGEKLLPPDLIIQDELHLLTGPLGTIIGIYEAGFKKLCEHNEHYPKVISSTATVKNAHSQIKSLYGDKYSQFPAQGLDIKDSFFAKESTQYEKPSRKYMGCMAVGTTPITMMVRVMAILYFASRYLSVCEENGENKFESDVIDSFWTITGYFNTLRELGGAIIRVSDDVDARAEILCNKYRMKYRWDKDDTIKNPVELTSRISSSEINKILRKIEDGKYENEFQNKAEDFLLATNMISVGVDIDRLGSMIVVGQPKMTAEYIQSTSRVGRKNPGLVLTTYNQKKSRDRSHFEQFKQYHQSFYKFVEATSITPFSDRARDRALQTIYVMLCRYLIPELRPNNAPGEYKNREKESYANSIKEIKEFILKIIKNIDKKEVKNAEKELNEIDEIWYRKALKYKETIEYYKQNKQDKKCSFIYKDFTHPAQNKSNSEDGEIWELFQPDIFDDERFRAMSSMRSVEQSAMARLDITDYGVKIYDKEKH